MQQKRKAVNNSLSPSREKLLLVSCWSSLSEKFLRSSSSSSHLQRPAACLQQLLVHSSAGRRQSEKTSEAELVFGRSALRHARLHPVLSGCQRHNRACRAQVSGVRLYCLFPAGTIPDRVQTWLISLMYGAVQHGGRQCTLGGAPHTGKGSESGQVCPQHQQGADPIWLMCLRQ